jgi:hypothetical protein
VPHSASDDVNVLLDNIDKLEQTLACADENGLFKNCSKDCPTYNDILTNMVDAYKALKNSDPPETKVANAWPKYRTAHSQLNQVLNSTPLSWRFKYLYGGPFIAYFLALLAVIVTAWFILNPATTTKVLWIPVYAFFWGAIGGILQGLWFLWQHVNTRKVRKAWIPWYIFLPFMGAILGALTYLVFVAGFITATGGTQIQSEYFIMLLCALAGFSTRWAVSTLDSVMKLIKIGK